MFRTELIATLLAGLVLVHPPGLVADERGDAAAAATLAEYREHFRGMLAGAFGAEGPDLRAAERHYRAAQSLQPDDPRIEYGYGLVLMKLHKHTDGVAHIERAGRIEPPYLPAQRALIREAIRQGDHPRALEKLVALAEQIAAPDRRGDPASQETAHWMGIVVDFFAGPAELETLADDVLEADAAIRRALPAELQQHYDNGQQQTQAVVARLDTDERTAREQAEQQQKQQQSATQARIAESKSRQQQLEEARKEQQLRTVDTSASLEDQLEQVSDRFESLNRTAASLLQSIQAAQLALQQLKTQAETRSSDGNPNNRFLEAQVLTRSRELDLLITEYGKTVQSREATARQGQTLVARWKATMTQARRTDTAANAQLQKFEKLNQQLTRSLQESKQTAPRSRQLRSIANRRRSFTTYDPFDLDQEQQRLAAELKLADN